MPCKKRVLEKMINPNSLDFIEFTKSHIATIHPWFEGEDSNWVEEPTPKFIEYVDSVDYEYNKYLVYDKDLPVAYVLFGIENGRGGIALVVNPACRRKGHGRAVVNYIIKRLSTSHCESIGVSVRPRNHQSLAFFRSMGFKDCGDGPDEQGALYLVYDLSAL